MKAWLFIWIIIAGIQDVSAYRIAEPGIPEDDYFPPVKSLTIGDKVPEITFTNMLNYKSKSAKLSDFRGKLVILDFWSTTCSACIGGFPKMEALQKAFGDKIQILLVNPHINSFDTEEKIKTVLNRLKIKTGFYPSLPIPIHDSILNSYFPHQAIPHQVWIDATGKVAAITGSNEVTSANIQAALDGQAATIPVKNDWAIDPEKPVLFENGLDISNIVSRSVFTKYMGGIYTLNASVKRNDQKEVTGMFLVNYTLRDLVVTSYNDVFNTFPASRIIWEVEVPQRFSKDFMASNAYCYDLIIPPVKSAKFRGADYLKDDLKHTFNIHVRTEKRNMNCAVVRATNSVSQQKSNYPEPDLDLEPTSLKKYFHRYAISDILVFLDQNAMPLINETANDQLIDIDLPEGFDFSNSSMLKKVLEEHGFSVTEEQRLVEVAVISDK